MPRQRSQHLPLQVSVWHSGAMKNGAWRKTAFLDSGKTSFKFFRLRARPEIFPPDICTAILINRSGEAFVPNRVELVQMNQRNKTSPTCLAIGTLPHYTCLHLSETS
jgi:hypothetical protein